MDIQSNVENGETQAKKSSVSKRKFSCLRVFVVLTAVVIGIFISFEIYGTVVKETFNYKMNGRQILTIKYPKAYHVQVDSDNPDQQGFRLLSSTSIEYSDLMIFTVYKRGINKTYSSPEQYLSAKGLGNCVYKQYGNNKICFSTSNPGLGLLSSNDYLIDILITNLGPQGKIGYILNSLTIY